MRLIYPSDTFNPKAVDEIYADEFAAAQAIGLPVSLFSFESFLNGSLKVQPAIQNGESVLFRSWMMTADDYTRLHNNIISKGGHPITDVSAYLLCHHLPNWYPALREFTAETRTYSENDNIEDDLRVSGWEGCFLKDYVKSLSTDGGSLVRNLTTIPEVIARMRKYRGQIEGGLCARRIEQYDEGTEKRYFVWHGVAYSDSGDIPEIVQQAAQRIASPFFTVDVACRLDGTLRIIELGDGQVSDRKHWNSTALISVLNSH